MRLTCLVPAIAAGCVGLALFSLAIMLAGLGMFCFEGSLASAFSDSTSTAPDCFLVRVNAWAHPKLWLLANLSSAIVLGIWAHAVGYGLLKGRDWVNTLLLIGALSGIAYFAELAVALPELRTLGVTGAALLLGVVVVHLFYRRSVVGAGNRADEH